MQEYIQSQQYRPDADEIAAVKEMAEAMSTSTTRKKLLGKTYKYYNATYIYVLVTHNGRQARLFLDQETQDNTLGDIEYLDTGESSSVSLHELSLVSIKRLK